MTPTENLWNETASELAAEDPRTAGLTLTARLLDDGTHDVIPTGPAKALGVVTDLAYRPILRNIVRKIAKDQGLASDLDLTDAGWPRFEIRSQGPVQGVRVSPALRIWAGSQREEPEPEPAPASAPDPEDFRRIGREIGDLVAEKNAAYGNSFNTAGDALRLLYPEGIRPDQYDDALAVVRVWDKLMRIATDRDALGESPFRDVAGYGILGAERVERLRRK